MTKPAFTTGAFVLAVAAVAAAPPHQTQRETRERHIVVSAVNDREQPVRELTAADFIVREDDIAREVLRVGPASPASDVALLVDDGQASRNLITELRQGLTSFTRQLLAASPDVQIAFSTFGERPTHIVDYTNSPIVLSKGVERLFSRTGAGAYFLEAIIEVCQRLKKRESARPVIVAFVNEGGPEFSNLTNDRIREALQGVGASLWAVTLDDNAPDQLSREARERAIVLGDVTRISGGLNKPILTRQAIESAFKTIATLLTSQYDITYGRPESLIPPTRLEVTARRKDVRILAPRWTGPAK
jgi:hypothetical protein